MRILVVWRSGSRAAMRSPKAFKQRIFASIRLRAWCPPRPSGTRRRLVDAASGDECPNRPRHFVRQRNRDQHLRFAGQHPCNPRSRRGSTTFLGRPYHGHRADDQQVPQIPLPNLRCSSRPGSSSRRVLTGRQAHPGGEILTLGKISGGGARTAKYTAVTGAIPGMVISRRATSFCLAVRRSCNVNASMRSVSWVIRSNMTRQRLTTVAGRMSSTALIS